MKAIESHNISDILNKNNYENKQKKKLMNTKQNKINT